MSATRRPTYQPSSRPVDLLDAAEIMALAHDPHGAVDLPIRWSLERDCWQYPAGMEGDSVYWMALDPVTLESAAITAICQAGLEVTEANIDGVLRVARCEMAA